jgi:hypothetical protein
LLRPSPRRKYGEDGGWIDGDRAVSRVRAMDGFLGFLPTDGSGCQLPGNDKFGALPFFLATKSSKSLEL